MTAWTISEDCTLRQLHDAGYSPETISRYHLLRRSALAVICRSGKLGLISWERVENLISARGFTPFKHLTAAENKMSYSKFWMVMGSDMPKVRHETEALANAEADRLTRAYPSTKFYVLEAISVFEVSGVIRSALQ